MIDIIIHDMYGIFYGKSSFNSNISNWNVGRVTNMAYMFGGGGGSSFDQTHCPWGPKLPSNFAYGTYAAGMFDSSGCTNKNRPSPYLYCKPNSKSICIAHDIHTNA